jgi:hypothetical protein
VRSFYLAPEFLVPVGDRDDDAGPDERVSEIIDAVIENEHITTLGLWQTHFSDASVAHVARVLNSNPRITSLSIENPRRLTPAGLSALADALGPSKLRTLSLKIPPQSSTPTADGGADDAAAMRMRFDQALGRLFTAALRTSDQLRSITIAPTDTIADLRDGAGMGNLSYSLDALAQSLVANAGSIVSVDISGVQAWGDDEINSLLHALAWRGGEHTLTRLALTNTSCGDQGAMALAGFLKGSGTTTVLNTIELDYSNIGDAGVTAIAKAIKHQSLTPFQNQLRHLSLVNTPISTVGAVALLDALRHNRQVRAAKVRAATKAPEGSAEDHGTIPTSADIGFGLESIALRRTGHHVRTLQQEAKLPKIDKRLLQQIHKECALNRDDRLRSQALEKRHGGKIPSLELLGDDAGVAGASGTEDKPRHDEM